MNTLRLPCRASYFVRALDREQISEAVCWARKRELGLFVLGAGSNIVLPRQLNALVLQVATRGIHELTHSGQHVVVDAAAGEDWHGLVESVLSKQLYGLENLALIPGTVGAAPVQNIGAYGVELEQFVHSVHALDINTMEWLELSRSDCGFSYRNSLFRQSGQRFIIDAVRLRLCTSPDVNIDYAALHDELGRRGIEQPTPRQLFDAVVHIRSGKLPNPRVLPNAGSFFKNPVVDAAHFEHLRQRFPGVVSYPQPDGRVKLAAAWLIERAGFKGKSREGVGMHHRQALVLVNDGAADGEQVLAFAAEVASTVRDMFDVSLQREPLQVGNDGTCHAG